MDIRKAREEIIYLGRREPELALKRASALVSERPNELWTWSLRSAVYEQMGLYDEALSDIDKAIEIEFNEPCSHYEKAGIYLEIKDYYSALASLSDAIDVGNSLNFPYYDSSCRFKRAFCYCIIGDFEAAEADLHKVEDDMVCWIDRLRTKFELMEACRNRRLD
jgi:tetratricopeptide (TPR) repeat protein